MEFDASRVSVRVGGLLVTVTSESVERGDELDGVIGNAVTSASASRDAIKVKTSFYQDDAEAKRMRAAYVATQALERRRSLSEFISIAVRKEVERLEDYYHGGQAWAAVEPGEIPKGAPLRT